MRIDSPCHLLPASLTAVILAKHTPLPLDTSGEQLVELSSLTIAGQGQCGHSQPAQELNLAFSIALHVSLSHSW